MVNTIATGSVVGGVFMLLRCASSRFLAPFLFTGGFFCTLIKLCACCISAGTFRQTAVISGLGLVCVGPSPLKGGGGCLIIH